MNKLFACICCLNVLLMTVTGCGQAKPDGLPPLQKVSLILQQDGSPLAGASVSLFPEDKSIKWSVGGRSNDRGEVVLRTHGQYTGVPLGKYVITVTKQEFTQSSLPETAPLDPGEYAEWQRKKEEEVLPVYDLVNPTLGSQTTSTLTIEITKESKSETIDCGSAIRQERKR